MTTAEVAKISGATERQLQWWDERHYIRPEIRSYQRNYTPAQCTLCNALADMRARKIPLRRAVQIMKALAIVIQDGATHDARWLCCGTGDRSRTYFAADLASMAGVLPTIEGAVYIQQVRRCTDEPVPKPRLQARVRRVIPRAPTSMSPSPSRANTRAHGRPDPIESRMSAQAANSPQRSGHEYSQREIDAGVEQERMMIARAEQVRDRLANMNVGDRW